MFDGGMESTPFIGEGKSTMSAWPATFDLGSHVILETGIRTHGTGSVFTWLQVDRITSFLPLYCVKMKKYGRV